MTWNPPPVPTVPAAERVVGYDLTAAASVPVPFTVWGDVTDLFVTLDGVEYTTATLVSPSGLAPLSPITDGRLNFSPVVTGHLVIDGRRAPRRTSNTVEGGDTARARNIDTNTIVATLVELERRADRSLALTPSEVVEGGQFDARSHRITNGLDGIAGTDFATVEQLSALSGNVPFAIFATRAEALAGTLTLHAVDPDGLKYVLDTKFGNVDNTHDIDKIISSLTQAALNLKADKTTTDGQQVQINALQAAASGGIPLGRIEATWAALVLRTGDADGIGAMVLSSDTGFHSDPVTTIATTVTMTIASPAVVTWNAHGLIAGATVVFTTTGALPTGVTAGNTYFVIAAGLTTNTFQFSATFGGGAVNTSGTQSGTHTATASPTVPNAGLYQRHASAPIGWKWLGAFIPAPVAAPPWVALGPIVVRRAVGGSNDVLMLPNFRGFNGTTTVDSVSPTTAVRPGAPMSVTMTIASPCVVTWTAHGLAAGANFQLTTTGALPTGVAALTNYYVLATGLTANNFQFSLTPGGAAINSSGTQSGAHSASYKRVEPEYFRKKVTGFSTGGPQGSAMTMECSKLIAGVDPFTETDFLPTTVQTTIDQSKPEIVRTIVTADGNNAYMSMNGLPIIGEVPNGCVRNMSLMGMIDFNREGKKGADTVVVPVTDASAIAAGMTFGVYSPTGPGAGGAGAAIAVMFPEPLPPGKWATFRCAVVTDTPNIFPEVTAQILTRNSSQSTFLVLLEKVSTTFAYLWAFRRLTLTTPFSAAIADRNQWATGLNFVQSGAGALAKLTLGLIQCHYGEDRPMWISDDDFGGVPPDNIMCDDTINLIKGKKLHYFEKQVVDARRPQESPRLTLTWESTDKWDGDVAHLWNDPYLDGSRIVSGTGFFMSRPKKAGNALRYVKNVAIKVADPATFVDGVPVYQLHIGDSLTAGTGHPVYIDRKIKLLVGAADLSAVWALGSTICHNNLTDKSVLGEGRTGKTTADYCQTDMYDVPTGSGLKQIGVVDPVDGIMHVPNFAAYLALDDNGRQSYSPFTRLTAAGDNPSLVKNGRIVDFAWYATGMGWTNEINVVDINLGTNDIPDIVNGIPKALEGHDILYKMARRRWPNALIVVTTNPLPFATINATENDFKWEYSNAPFIKQLMAQVRGYRAGNIGGVTTTIASPCIFGYANHKFTIGQKFTLTTTGALPTGLAIATPYYVVSTPDANTFTASATLGGAPIATSGSQSGLHTLTTFPDPKVIHFGAYQFTTEEGGDAIDIISTDSQTSQQTGTITAHSTIHKGDAAAQQYAEAFVALYANNR